LPNIFILAGGFGTRLNSVVNDVPKPLAPINDIPFLEYQINEIRKFFNQTKIYLLTFHLSNKIEKYYSKNSMIEIIKENKPLGTGGAIKNAISELNLKNDDDLLIFNGDTYMKPNLETFINTSKYDVNVISMYQEKCERSSTLLIENNEVKSFSKQGAKKKNSYISIGCYYIKNSTFIQKNQKDSFMIEDEFIKYSNTNKIGTYLYNGVFIDIGVPEDYEKMRNYIKNAKK
tara:strand:- start:2945 stop:3637 length:693 start_codon:yes stop_codon:yes gene_type:complete